MQDKIYELIAGWASTPTWYTAHPLDEKRFNHAMERIVTELGTDINIDDFRQALSRYATSTPEMLGAPKEWENFIEKFVLKAQSILEFERDRSSAF